MYFESTRSQKGFFVYMNERNDMTMTMITIRDKYKARFGKEGNNRVREAKKYKYHNYTIYDIRYKRYDLVGGVCVCVCDIPGSIKLLLLVSPITNVGTARGWTPSIFANN